jgi:hypothetical protein
VEVHHIVPEAEAGPDTEDNAAPLCPSCHETYGANPDKRKFIREARDFWYELCRTRLSGLAGVTDTLQRICDCVESAATKEEIRELDQRIDALAEALRDRGMVGP